MVNYQLGKIYKIECNITGEVYVGSTCEPLLARRLAGHVSNYKRYLNGKGNYVTSFKILENNDYDIVLIEKYPCNDKDELLVRERYWTKQIECINKLKNQGLFNELGETEYNKQYNKKYYEEHYEANKDRYNQKHTCECGGCYSFTHKSRHMKTAKHMKYKQNDIIYVIQRGLHMIKAIDKHID